MGCCASRPEDTFATQDQNPPPQVRHSPQAITSQTAINPTANERPPQLLEPPLTTSIHRSETSRSELSTPRRNSANRNGSQQVVDLAEHYNLPLQPPKSWTSKEKTWTKSQLQRERYEFFETRVTGRREIWDALRQVAECLREGDITTAQGIVDAVGVTLPTGRIEEGGYDEAGNLYKIPEAVVSDPTNVIEDVDGDEQTVIGTAEAKEGHKSLDEGALLNDPVVEATKEDKGKAAVEKDAVKVKCRLSDRGGPDVIVLLGRSQTVGILAQRIRDDGEVPSTARIRIAYLGRMLDEKQTLSQQGWKEGHVVNAMVAGVFGA